MTNYYAILGIYPRATQTEIKAAFRKLALRYHPDKNKTKSAEAKFKDIITAYKTLSDPLKKSHYDLSLYSLSSAKPRYHSNVRQPRYTDYSSPDYTLQLVSYLPYFKRSCWVGLALAVLVALDYCLPTKYLEDKIISTDNFYVYVSRGMSIYDHSILVTEKERLFVLSHKDLPHFESEEFIRIYFTPMFSQCIAISPKGKDYKVDVDSLVYGNLFFVPLILFIVSGLGLLDRAQSMRVINFSIVSFLLTLILIYIIS